MSDGTMHMVVVGCLLDNSDLLEYDILAHLRRQQNRERNKDQLEKQKPFCNNLLRLCYNHHLDFHQHYSNLCFSS